MAGLRFAMVVAGLSASMGFAGDVNVYSFIDSAGEVYLSNIPDDARYQALVEPEAETKSVTRSATAPSRAPGASERRPYSDVISSVAGRMGLEAALLHAVIFVESGYNANAVSKQGAAGLMQLMPATARRYGVADVFDPAENIRGGAQYLADLLKMFDDDVALALAAYNSGEATVLRHGKRIPPSTGQYVPKVVDFYHRFRAPM